ncbi:hypothetical protein NQZ68_028405 [Dissostichus eleginoides]|nr:hypothetical protein NQZ68_028405 [Dissostichus eleginoides]
MRAQTHRCASALFTGCSGFGSEGVLVVAQEAERKAAGGMGDKLDVMPFPAGAMHYRMG